MERRARKKAKNTISLSPHPTQLHAMSPFRNVLSTSVSALNYLDRLLATFPKINILEFCYIFCYISSCYSHSSTFQINICLNSLAKKLSVAIFTKLTQVQCPSFYICSISLYVFLNAFHFYFRLKTLFYIKNQHMQWHHRFEIYQMHFVH